PHAGLLTLAVALMIFQSFASSARVLLLYPILTRVFPVEEAVQSAGAPAATPAKDGAEASGARGALKEARHRAGSLLHHFDSALDAMNGVTSAWVPDAWASTPEWRDRYATLWTVLVLFLAFLLVMSICAYFEDYVNEIVRLRILMDVRRSLCAKLLSQPISFYDKARRGDVVQRVLDDVHGFASGLRLVFSSLVEGMAHIVSGVVVLALMSVELTVVCVLGLLLFLPLQRLTSRVRRQAKRRQSTSARRVEVLLQIVSGVRTVKAYGAEDRKVAEFHEADLEVYRKSLKVQRTKSLGDAVTEFLNNVLVMALVVGGSFVVLRGVLPLGPEILILFISQVGNLYRPAKRLVKDLNGFNDSMASVERVFDVLDLDPLPPDPPGAVPLEGFTGAIRFEGVGFSYRPGLPVLEDVSFDVPRGATVALVGPSGSGKSTLCDLLLRFYEPTEGRITVDGRPLTQYRRASWLGRSAVVTQDPFLFHTTIRENIGLGRPGATDAEIEAAARAAQIHDHIASLPQGYDTEVGERGARLSGGQRQRITIARALLRDPIVLVLDEATASLDAQSERAVQEALERLQAGRTTLVVAHRLSTVQRATRIVVLDQGRVVDQGTHRELLARGGLYARLCAMQNLGNDPPQADPVAVAPPPLGDGRDEDVP
ncbi:MAG TPA: ABC transporter ATP-binding protein, partial [Planctomycetota bacterium]|nr:ABC transporter ATP-binding protein [Planctomycetota bacterium]